jgi:hypothetical protein
MTLPGLVAANNLSDVVDRERAWDSLGLNISATWGKLQNLDPDASAYIDAVALVEDGYTEPGVQRAINDFVLGCKADGIWTAIKASCILAGAGTLAGALVPLVGTAPTSFDFVPGDYNRKTGLMGNGSTKYLNSNRNNNADPRDNNHNACWVSSPDIGALMASSSSNSGQNYLDMPTLTASRFYSRTSLGSASITGAIAAGLYGHRRSVSSSYLGFCPQGSATFTASSQAAETRPVFLYTRSNDGAVFSLWSTARLAFYSIGESLDLALLNARVTALIAAFGSSIP